MKLKDADIKVLTDLFEEALNRAQRVDQQQKIKFRKKIVFECGCGLKEKDTFSNGMRTGGDRHRGPLRGRDPNVNHSRRNVL